jgi:hypothetical protein
MAGVNVGASLYDRGSSGEERGGRGEGVAAGAPVGIHCNAWAVLTNRLYHDTCVGL